jgi:signal transduction histidine kinase
VSALHLRRRVARAAEATAYLAVSVPIAVLGVSAVVVLAVGAALSVAGGIGLPVLLAGAAACRGLVRLDRRAANHFLGTQIPPLAIPPRPATGSLWRRSLSVLQDRALWRTVGLLGLKPVLTAGQLVVGIGPVVLMAWLAKLGVEAIAGLGDADYFGPWSFGAGTGIALLALTLPVAVLALAALDALHTVMCTVCRALLLPRHTTATGPVRELLAESLGDHSVSIAYWLPDREIFVDEVGRRVELPHPASGRTWTTVERDGRPVAAIVHDAALDTTSELVHAAASASSLAIDNERLKADLRARLEELRVSRLRIVEATDAARRRIERDLHDGAQQQLVALALEIRLLRARVGDQPEVAPLVDSLSHRLSSALAELRELARGIHPTILTDQGLAPAVEALATRAPLPVEAEVTLEGRLAEPVEAAAYFVVAEALTNVVKYAHASYVDVRIRRENGEVLVDVADDGVGGVDLGAGSGLRGLQDRLAAVDGELDIDSPAGGGTRLRARIPAAEVTEEGG